MASGSYAHRARQISMRGGPVAATQPSRALAIAYRSSWLMPWVLYPTFTSRFFGRAGGEAPLPGFAGPQFGRPQVSPMLIFLISRRRKRRVKQEKEVLRGHLGTQIGAPRAPAKGSLPFAIPLTRQAAKKPTSERLYPIGAACILTVLLS